MPAGSAMTPRECINRAGEACCTAPGPNKSPAGGGAPQTGLPARGLRARQQARHDNA
jgi:hypothetical protein